jgi:hypothetical protein
MRPLPPTLLLLANLIPSLLAASTGPESPSSPDFFKNKIQPLLANRCFECHSHDKKIKGGLALDSRSGWEQGGDNGPAIRPGQPDQSLIIKAVRYLDADFAMPPKAKLPPEEIALLEAWIQSGAPDPRTSESKKNKPTIDLVAGKTFWAFKPIQNPTPPTLADPAWPTDPLDTFIRSTQEKQGVRPAPDASRHTWLRRVSLDLTGLPPSENEIRAFENDRSDKAFETVVDRLLANPSYGERWARHWLDLTGYADMMGTSNAVYAEHAWRYRDYLINAFNTDKPFDEFVREQIAGDLLPPKSTEDHAENIVATGFLMVGDIEIVNPDKAKMEADHIDTQVAKIGQTFLGMTLGCARCHDHKFDPVGLEDYYAIAGTLRSSPSSHKMPDMGVWSTLNSTPLPETPAQREARAKQEAETDQKIARLKDEQKTLTEEKTTLSKQLAALEKPAPPAPTASTSSPDNAEREPAKPASPEAASPSTTDNKPTPDKETLTKRRDEIDGRLKKIAGDITHADFFKDKTPRAFAMADGPTPSDMPIYIRGNPYATSTIVPRGTLRVASWEPFPPIPTGQSGRLQLAHWLADKRNPLTARVAVNRIWQKLFNTGIVPSVDYFGTRGELPTHPELLDHLASRFMANHWSQKQLLRALVLSRTYRLSSANLPESNKLDPTNKTYWRMNRQRLDAEAIRDSLLAISGELARDSGGPALVLENPENCGSLSLKGVNPPNYKHAKPREKQEFERTIYLPVFRNGLSPSDKLRAVFDFIDPATTAGQRTQTVVPTQSLFLLNNALVRKRASTLASQLLANPVEDSARIQSLWLKVLNRPVTTTEQTDAVGFLQSLREASGNKPNPTADWTELCHSLLSSNEFVFRL